ncbi:hypothetical protein ACFB49_47220 [Sphingomonas sp. DBB INV C78]|uniref:hypothetical protein n=1 Tax=Sphingomonas sp. DBB INV C78 TaxID=3349434 RepID=UPI0036D3A363
MTALITTLHNSRKVATVDKVAAFSVDIIGIRLLVSALGSVNSSGWSNIRLSPVYYIDPPADGIWDFDLIGDPPVGPVLTVMLPVAAFATYPCPDWVKGVRIHAQNGSLEDAVTKSDPKAIAEARPAIDFSSAGGRALVEETIAVYDDSFQPIGFCSGFPPHIKMKKLRHELVLIIEAPDEAQIRRCLNEAIAAGLVAAIAAVIMTGGGALAAAIAAFQSYLSHCIAGSTIRFDNRSHWIEWCT